jgi:hypothetical protein
VERWLVVSHHPGKCDRVLVGEVNVACVHECVG